MEISEMLYFTDRKGWRAWLKANHKKRKDVWLVYYKKASGKPRIPYDDAVEEAICWGWIDSTVKKLDDEKYCQRYTPRKPRSIWSELNKNRAEKMIKQKKMAKAGYAAIEAAKKSGQWDKAYSSKKLGKIPADVAAALKKRKKAHAFWEAIPRSHKFAYVHWIEDAKREDTRKRRIDKLVQYMLDEKRGLM